MGYKTRLLNGRLAAAVAGLRHGEMLMLADAGSGTSSKSLVPLAGDVEVIDVGVATGVPSLHDLLPPLWEVGDFETAIVASDMRAANPSARELVDSVAGREHVREITYLPDMYQLRDRVKVFVQTGDYAVHANVILVAGYPSPVIPYEWLESSSWYDDLVARRAGRGAGED